jgi:hypothetical protein
MLRDQMINFLQTAVVFLLLTNGITALAAVYAVKMARACVDPARATRSAVERRLDAILTRAA